MTLCKYCEIFDICHEPRKHIEEEMCMYFKGKTPEGYIYYRSTIYKFHPQYWKYYVGYIMENNEKKKWLNQQQSNNLILTT